MSITRKNYEVYFLDYLEGNLNPGLENEFRNFLDTNPDLAEELQDMENEAGITLQSENATFLDKNLLKKNESDIHSDSFDNRAIAYIENDLQPSEKLQFEKEIITHPEAKSTYLLFKKTKLIPDTSIKFPNKSILKKVFLIGLPKHDVYRVFSIAASIILVLSLYFIIDNNNTVEKRGRISQQTPVSISSEETPQDIANVPAEKEASNIPSKSKEGHTALKEPPKSTEPVLLSKKNSPEKKQKVARKIENPQIDPKQKNEDDKKDTKHEIPDPIKSMKKVDPKKLDPDSKKKNAAKKRMVKPVQIHSQGLLASNTYVKPVVEKDNNNQFLSLKQLATRLFKKNVLKQKEEDINSDKLDFWEIADAGAKGLSKVTKKDIKVIRQYNTEGELIAYALESPLLSFEKNVKKK